MRTLNFFDSFHTTLATTFSVQKFEVSGQRKKSAKSPRDLCASSISITHNRHLLCLLFYSSPTYYIHSFPSFLSFQSPQLPPAPDPYLLLSFQKMAGLPRSDPYGLPDCRFSLCEPLKTLVSWFCGLFSCGMLDASGSYNPPLLQDCLSSM